MFEKLAYGMRGHDTKCSTIEELADTLGKLGVEHVQLALKKSFPDVTWRASLLTPALGQYMKETLADKGVKVSILGCYINPVHPDEDTRRIELEWFKANLKFAKYLGADMVGTETGFYQTVEDTHSEENYQRFLTSMKELVHFSEKIGTIVGIEAVTKHSLYNPSVTKRFLDDINSPNITIIYDPVNISDENDLALQHKIMNEVYALYGDRIGILHFKDYRVEDGKKIPLLAAEGVLDYEYLFRYVHQFSPCIDAVFETTTEETFADCKARMQSLWERTSL